MEETGAIQPTCHGIHMTIEHVAGAVSLRVGIGQGEAFGLGAQLEHGFLEIAGGVLLSPLAERFSLLAEGGCIGGMVDLPDLVSDLLEQGFEIAAAVADLDEGVQEALNDGDQGKEGQPGPLRGSPAIRIDRFRGYIPAEAVELRP